MDAELQEYFEKYNLKYAVILPTKGLFYGEKRMLSCSCWAELKERTVHRSYNDCDYIHFLNYTPKDFFSSNP